MQHSFVIKIILNIIKIGKAQPELQSNIDGYVFLAHSVFGNYEHQPIWHDMEW